MCLLINGPQPHDVAVCARSRPRLGSFVVWYRMPIEDEIVFPMPMVAFQVIPGQLLPGGGLLVSMVCVALGCLAWNDRGHLVCWPLSKVAQLLFVYGSVRGGHYELQDGNFSFKDYVSTLCVLRCYGFRPSSTHTADG